MKNDKLSFSKSSYVEIIDHCRSELPFEACGILSGINHTVYTVWKLNNEIKSDRRFFIGKETVNKTLQKIIQKREEVLGIYHSHPSTAPIPSNTDLFSHPDTNVKMIIVSLKKVNPIMKCYKIENKNYKEVTVIVN